jgi:hypothetical protein
MAKPCKHSSRHIFNSIVIKLGQDARLSNCSDEFNGSGERSRAISAQLLNINDDKGRVICIYYGMF